MDLSRRDFASIVAGAVAGLALPGSARGLDDLGVRMLGGRARGRHQVRYFQWHAIGERVRVAMGGGGNTLLYVGSNGALQSDGKNFGLGRILRREAEAEGRPVTRFVNTHHHGDHSGGNDGFSDLVRLAHGNAEPRIVATAESNLDRAREALPRTLAQLREQDAPSAAVADVEAMLAALDDLTPGAFAPTETFESERELALEGRPVEVRWASRGHTDGDAFLYLPEENVLHCGDLLFHGRHPYVDVSADATPAGWIRCVDTMLTLCDGDTVVIPGHGNLTDRGGLAAQKTYFERLQDIVAEAIEEGRSRDEVTALAPADLAALPAAERMLPQNLGIVYDEMVG
ncbi:MAG: MBL fold metallo-hydrolase [Gemmatimonadota bacterium]|nr:MBL fold metallo-hydrolase [Gemmatimonadota bacterium]